MKKKAFRNKTSWAWQTFIALFSIALLWHLPLLFIEEGKSNKKLPYKGPQENVYLVLQPNPLSSSKVRNLWADPTIYLLPSEVGFSSYIRQTTISPKITFQTIPPPNVIQAFQPPHDGQVFTSAEALTMAQSSFDDAVLFEKKPGASVETPVQESSNWSVTGAVGSRLVSTRVNLPLISSTELLQPTILRIGISASGSVDFVMLDHKHSSGSEKADQAAIGFAKTLRFSTIASEDNNTGLAWGYLSIQWRGNDGLDIRTIP